MSKILIIGQAPPAVTQKYPYDTTMLYDWLKECNITVDEAQEIFEFDAVYNKFPGFEKGGHAVPTVEQMNEYWPELSKKIEKHSKLWILGNTARDYLITKEEIATKIVLFSMHPSKRNLDRYLKTKDSLIKQINKLIKM